MQPWKISAGLTTAIAGLAILLAGPRLEYLAPYWPLLLAEHGVLIALHLALALATVAGAIYAIARAAGLADLGSRVDLAYLNSPSIVVAIRSSAWAYLTVPPELPQTYSCIRP